MVVLSHTALHICCLRCINVALAGAINFRPILKLLRKELYGTAKLVRNLILRTNQKLRAVPFFILLS